MKKKRQIQCSIIPKKRQANNVTAADLERASRYVAELNRLDAAIRSSVISRFGEIGGIHDFRIFTGSNGSDAYIFMPFDRDLDSPRSNTLRQQVTEFVLDVLEAEGRGPRATIVLRVEMDSHERVQRDFNGNYYLRFR